MENPIKIDDLGELLLASWCLYKRAWSDDDSNPERPWTKFNDLFERQDLRFFCEHFPTVNLQGIYRKYWSIHWSIFQAGELGTTGENSRQVGGHIIVLAVGTETNEAFARARALGPAYDSYSTWWFRFLGFNMV